MKKTSTFNSIIRATWCMFFILMFIGFFWVLEDSGKLLSIFVFIPLILWVIFQESLNGASLHQLSQRLQTTWFVASIWVLVSFVNIYVEEGVYPGTSILYFFWLGGTLIILLLWSVFSRGNDYIPKITIESYSIYILLCSFWLFGLLNTLFIAMCLWVLTLILQKTSSRFLEFIFSISFAIISLTFWWKYVYQMFYKYNEGLFGGIDIYSFTVFWEMFFLWMSLGFMLQAFLMITTFLPDNEEIYGKNHRKEMKKMYQIFLDRFDEELTSKFSLFSVYLLTSILLLSYNWFLYTFLELELFIAWAMVWLPIIVSYISHYSSN